jgi:hypothetical protein
MAGTGAFVVRITRIAALDRARSMLLRVLQIDRHLFAGSMVYSKVGRDVINYHCRNDRDTVQISQFFQFKSE